MSILTFLTTEKVSSIFRNAFVFVLICIASLPSQASENDKADLTNLLQAYLESNEISGGVILVDAPGLSVEVAVGISDRLKNVAMTVDKRFYLASLGKPMVAAAILDAVSNNELKLNSKVTDLLKNTIGLEQLKGIKPVTVTQLLNHSSGLAEYFNDAFWNASLQEPDKKWRAEEAVGFAYNLPMEFNAGMKFQYTNTNYVLLGMILENLDGSLIESLQKRVLKPSGMLTATIGADPGDKSLTHGYDELGNDHSKIAWLSPLGDGPVVGSVTDIKQFVHALLREKTLLNAKTLALMFKGNKWEKSYGLGIGIEKSEFGKWYGHAGVFDGFEADFRYYPKHNLTIIYAINGNQIEDDSLTELIAQWYLGE